LEEENPPEAQPDWTRLGHLPGAAANKRQPFQEGKGGRQVSADQRGHGLGVSLGVYVISDLDQKIEAVTKLESAVIDASDEDDFEFVASGYDNPKAGLKKETE